MCSLLKKFVLPKTSCCCCGCSLRVGSLIIGWCAVGFWILFLMAVILGLIIRVYNWENYAPWLGVLSVLHIIMYSLLLAGVSEKNLHFLKISIRFFLFEVIILSLSNILWFILLFVKIVYAILLLLTLVITAVSIHWFQVLASYYEEIIKPTPAVQIV